MSETYKRGEIIYYCGEAGYAYIGIITKGTDENKNEGVWWAKNGKFYSHFPRENLSNIEPIRLGMAFNMDDENLLRLAAWNGFDYYE